MFSVCCRQNNLNFNGLRQTSRRFDTPYEIKTLHPLHPLHLKNVSRKPSHMSVPQRKAANTPTPICPFTRKLHVNSGSLRCITAACAGCIGFTHESEGCTNVLWTPQLILGAPQLVLQTPQLILDGAAGEPANHDDQDAFNRNRYLEYNM